MTWVSACKTYEQINQFHFIQLFLKDDLKINTEGTIWQCNVLLQFT